MRLVGPRVTDRLDVGAESGGGAGFGIFDRETLRGLLGERFHGVDVNCGVGLGGGRWERGGGAVDAVGWEEGC